MDPKRVVLQVRLDDLVEAEETFTTLMGDEVDHEEDLSKTTH